MLHLPVGQGANHVPHSAQTSTGKKQKLATKVSAPVPSPRRFLLTEEISEVQILWRPPQNEAIAIARRAHHWTRRAL